MLEFLNLRPDQPKLLNLPLSLSQVFVIFMMILGVIIVLDRLGYMRIPWIARPQTQRQRRQAYQKLQDDWKRQARAAEKEKLRIERRKARAEARSSRGDEAVGDEAAEES